MLIQNQEMFLRKSSYLVCHNSFTLKILTVSSSHFQKVKISITLSIQTFLPGGQAGAAHHRRDNLLPGSLLAFRYVFEVNLDQDIFKSFWCCCSRCGKIWKFLRNQAQWALEAWSVCFGISIKCYRGSCFWIKICRAHQKWRETRCVWKVTACRAHIQRQ